MRLTLLSGHPRRLLIGLGLCLAMVLLLIGGPSRAQEQGVWVQVEAQPTLAEAQSRVRSYAARLPDVAGFHLGNGWYAILIGPYAPEDADALLRSLRSQGQIPPDSYITAGNNFDQQYWPIGTGIDLTPRPLPGAVAQPATGTETAATSGATPEVTAAPLEPAPQEPAPQPEPVTAPEPAFVEETQSQALASEELLSRPQKEQLQIALQWAGFYEGAIDGAYGRGTRNAMANWQAANGHDATGVLTTRQRGLLLGAYNAVLEGLELQLVRDDAAGIEMLIPTGAVTFTAYEPPFVRFEPRGDIPAARVLLISQEGNQSRLAGLYEILQSLEIVPPEGARSRNDTAFTIEGHSATIRSYTQASLTNGHIKGFSLVWPAGDDERFDRLLAEMRASFTVIDGVLDPAIAPPDEDQAIDLISGLAIRQPQLIRSGFFITDDGAVLTTTEAVSQCSEITLAGSHPATVSFRDDRLGIAVLQSSDRIAPRAVAQFQSGVPRLQSEVAIAGFPYGTALSRPTLTFGTLADIRGLAGEEEVKRLAVQTLPGDAGGPVLDNAGAVLGMLLPRVATGGQLLPDDVAFSVDAEVILAALQDAGIAAQTTDSLAFVGPEALTRQAADIAVLVSCW